MTDPDIEFSKWKIARKKGAIRYVLLTSIPTVIGVSLAKGIDLFYYNDSSISQGTVIDFLQYMMVISTAAVSMTRILWWWKERKYKRHTAKFNYN